MARMSRDGVAQDWRPRLVAWMPLACIALSLLATGGCTTRRLAASALADALAQGGDTYARDGDPELVREAIPSGLKLMEGLLDEVPRHAGLLTAAAAGFTQYAYAFVQQEADETEARDLARARALRARARDLYLRAQGYGMRSLEVAHPGFAARLAANPADAVRQLTRADVPAVYWTAAAWAGAIALTKDRPALVARLPEVEAMMDRALALDEGFRGGALPTFMIAYEMSRPGGTGEPTERARRSFARAVELSGGRDAAPFVALAESVAVPRQDLRSFEDLLQHALAIDPDATPDLRLANLIQQRRARWLLGHKAELFLEADP